MTLEKKLSMDAARHLLPLVVGLVYFGLSWFVVDRGHLHEDAYIVFIFCENLAAGDGFVYSNPGSPSEGAVDFLWVLLVGVLIRCGINAALSAAILNATALVVLSGIMERLLWQPAHRVASWLVLALLNTLLLLMPVAAASYVGFSTAFFVGFVGLLFFIQTRNRSSLSVPYLSLLLGLVRPDGVIMAGLAVLLGLSAAIRRKQARVFLLHSGIACAAGLVYFWCRYQYFGHFLPLPLYVKSASAAVAPGLVDNYYWLSRSRWFLLSTLAFILLYRKQSLDCLVAALPAAAHLLALSVATQMQNVANRFQGPASVVLLLMSAVLWGRCLGAARDRRRVASVLLLVLVFFVGNLSIYWPIASSVLHDAVAFHYINSFPHILNRHLKPDTRIVMTEAGRMAYWTQGAKYDLVGLNTARTAIEGPSVEFLEDVHPDLMLVHTAGTLPAWICDQSYCEISPEAFESLVAERLREPDDHLVRDHVLNAPLVAYEYLLRHKSEYRIVFARFMGQHSHMYAVLSDGAVDYDRFRESLEWSYNPSSAMSYLQIMRGVERSNAAYLRQPIR